VTRRERIATVVLLGSVLACPACGEDACAAIAYTPSHFLATVAFDPGAATRLDLELCRNSFCSGAVMPIDAGNVRLTAPGFTVRFNFKRADAGLPTLSASYLPSSGMAFVNGDVWALRITDADSGQVLFAHSEAVTYTSVQGCEETYVYGSFSAFNDAGLPVTE
jgi:hypothetical protein